MNRLRNSKLDPPLAPIVAISLVAHIVLLGIFLLAPSKSPANEKPDYDIQEVDIVWAEDIGGGGAWGTPKRGKKHRGKIAIPKPRKSIQVPSKKTSTDKVKVRRKKTSKPKQSETSENGRDLLDPIIEALEAYNEGREGEHTDPDGDPNSKRPGPAGPPGGDVCSAYKRRAGRMIRRSGAVPEAAGKSTVISLVIGSGGGVSGKRVVKSSGVPHADSVALSLVPRSFGAPPAECGSVGMRVRVNFHGKKDSSRSARREPNKKKSKRKSKNAIQRALDDL